jgi:pimeloyl-ACP methyl ester carboxylesterase
VTPETLEIDGLAVQRWPSPGATASVVVVHGTMDRAASFRRLVRRLRDVEVVTYDRRGYAGSRNGRLSPSLDDQLRDLRAVVDVASHFPPTIFGHSFGALLALHLAARDPGSCGSLLAWEPPMPWLDWYVGAVGDRANELSRDADPEDVAEMFLKGMVGERVWNRMPATAKAERRAEGPALVSDVHLARDGSMRLDLSSISVKTIAACGGRSAPRFARTAALLMEQIPDAMLIEVADADHGVHLSHPDELSSLVAAAISRVA